ncbi:MAG: C10 family peptidase, partial [Tannerella sp.]|nr:C10 family peptidase [Tannerella sp.]
MKTIRLFMVLLCTLLMFHPMLAERVNVERAERVARSYASAKPGLAERRNFRHNRTVSKQISRNRPGLRSDAPEDEPLYHVFSMNTGEGFIIVAGDDVAKPILGYAEEGSFDETNENLAYWMETLAQEIAEAIENNVPQDADTQAEWEAFESENKAALRASGDYVDPLVTTKWNQSAPYNNNCPIISGGRAVTGCVATAMAQIMNYHKHPTIRTVEIPGYTTSTTKDDIPGITGTTDYKWDLMSDRYSSDATGPSVDAVAVLMLHCGVSVHMDYTPSSSGAFSFVVSTALRNYFGYGAGINGSNLVEVDRGYYSYTEWVRLLKTDLKAGRPVYYSGHGSGGHAFVCDGYDTDDLFHFNWGWGGYSDGYFELSALNPNGGNYSYGQRMTIGIQPAGGGGGQPVLYLQNISVNPTSLPTLSEPFDINGYYLGNSDSDMVGQIYLGGLLCHTDDTPIAYKTALQTLNLAPGSSINYQTIYSAYTLPPNLSAGTYKLYPTCAASESEMPAKIPMRNSAIPPYIVVTVAADGSVTFDNTTQPELTLIQLATDGNIYRNNNGIFTAEITNSGTNDYNSHLSLKLGDLEFTKLVVIPAGTTKTIQFEEYITVEPGLYDATILYDPANSTSSISTPTAQLGDATPIEVKAVPEGNPVLSLLSATFEPDADHVSLNNLNLTVELQNTGGLFNSYVYIFIYPQTGDNSITSYYSKSSIIIDDTPRSIVFNNSSNGTLTAETAYRARVYANGYIGDYIPFTTAPISPISNATLSSLTVKDLLTGQPLTLYPPFDSNTLGYTATVSSTVVAVSVTGEATHPRAKFTSKDYVALADGTNTVSIPVTSEDGETTLEYQVMITQGDNPAFAISIGTFMHGSISITPDQTLYAAGDAVSVTVSPDEGYELDKLSAILTAFDTEFAITDTENENTYTFTMPAGDVTIEASFRSSETARLAEAKTLIEAADIATHYTAAQTQANTEEDLKAWLAGRLNTILSGTDLDPITEADITLDSFTPASQGTDGSFSFTVTLTTGSSHLEAAITGGIITAAPVYGVTVAAAENGSITADKPQASEGETVTLTITPSADYILSSVK